MKRSDIVPIVYMSGLGGHFLSSLLCNARDNSIDNWNFGTTGVCHYVEKDFVPTGNVTVPSKIHLKVLLSEPVTGKTKYYPTHMTDVALASLNFEKVIKIYCDEADINDVLKVYSKKISEGTDAVNAVEMNYNWLKIQMEKYRTSWSPNFELDNVLHISWKEMICEPIDSVIEKLSEFTDLPKLNFEVEKFEHWRKLTLRCINE